MTTWTYHDATKSQSAAAVATVFGASVFDPPRDLESCWGNWGGYGRFVGGFRLKDTDRTFRIDGFDGGRWEVSRA